MYVSLMILLVFVILSGHICKPQYILGDRHAKLLSIYMNCFPSVQIAFFVKLCSLMCKGNKRGHVIVYINESNISGQSGQSVFTNQAECAWIWPQIHRRMAQVQLNDSRSPWFPDQQKSQTAFVPSQRLKCWQFIWFSSNETSFLVHNIVYTQIVPEIVTAWVIHVTQE